MKPNSPAIAIRLATPHDAQSISSILKESFLEYRSSYTEEGFAATTPTGDEVLKRLKEGPIWVVLTDDAIVGTVSAIPQENGLYIRGMAILPAARGQNIGELLLKQIEKFASEHGFKRLFLSTTPFLHRAIRLYERFGFRRTDWGADDLFGTPLFTMEKILES